MEDRVKYVQVTMRDGYQHPKVVFMFGNETGITRQMEMVLDTNDLSVMFDEAVMGYAPDVMTTAHGVGVQYSMDYAHSAKYLGGK